MMPVVFRIPYLELDIPGFGLMLMLGFLISILWAARRAARSGANPDVVLNCGFVALLAGVVGARAMFVLHYWDQFASRGSAWNVFWAIVDVRMGGLEFYGGFLLSVVLVVAWIRWYEKVSLRWYLDIIAPSAALGLAFGRVGCLLNGCCYGTTCELPWAVRFPVGSPAAVEQWEKNVSGAALPEQLLYVAPAGNARPVSRESLAASDGQIERARENEAKLRTALTDAQAAADKESDPSRKRTLERRAERARADLRAARAKFEDVRALSDKYATTPAALRALAHRYGSAPVHPTQVYSTITALLIALTLNALYWRRTRDGQVILTLLLIEPVSRWVIELIRADNPIDTLGAFTISQGLAMGMTLIGLFGLIALRALPPRSPRARVWVPEDEARPAARKPAPIA